MNRNVLEVYFRATEQLVGRYRKLLTKDWTEQTLLDTLSLIEDTLAEGGLRVGFGRPVRKPPPAPKAQAMPIPAGASEWLREYLENLNYQRSSAADVPREPSDAAEQAELALVFRTSWHLTFPASVRAQGPGDPGDGHGVRLMGNVGFFDDIRSILYQCAVFELLPRLGKKRPMRHYLVDALDVHTRLVWSENAAHQAFLKGLLEQELGDFAAAAKWLRASFLATDPGEHDYMTTAYAYWAHLMDVGAADEATAFALQLFRAVRTELLDEAKELVDESYGRSLAIRRHRGR